jgi:hypothetical protein
MSIFAKVLSRAAAPGSTLAPLAQPKGSRGIARREEEELAQPLRRREEEEEAQPLRRQEEEEEAQPLRRQEEEEEAQPLRRQEEEEEAQPLRRQEEEEELAQPLRRQEEEEAQALRRQAEGVEEEEEALQTIRRAVPGGDESLEPDDAPTPEDTAMEPELPDMQALRREAAPQWGGASVPAEPFALAPNGPETPFDNLPPAPAFEPPAGPPLPSSASRFDPSRQRPTVTIDQIDVVIHEDAGQAGPSASPAADLGRTLRARYLGGL